MDRWLLALLVIATRMGVLRSTIGRVRINMTWKNLILVPFLALAPVLVGCGADCEDVCEKSNDECDGEDADCSKTCSKAEDLAEKAGCEDEFDDFVSCADDSDDICDEDSGCDSESEAYVKCVVSYCTSHQTESACTALSE
jgi:hypothetical protein